MYQSGSRINHSPDYHPAQLIDFLLTSMDKQLYTGMILIDLCKIFVILNYGVLLEKMKYFGFQTSAIKWFGPYLSNRNILASIDVFSDSGTLNYGVPHAFILGLLLFLLCVNDLPQSLSEYGSYLYADRT